MADKTEIASIEFGQDGQYAVISRKSNGVAFHPNHYLSDELIELNPAAKCIPIGDANPNVAME